LAINVRARVTKRSDIPDLFSSPFWSEIPDKPSSFTPSPHSETHRKGGSDEVLNVTNINDAVGFTVESHSSRHKFGGSDELGRAAKLIVSTDGTGDYSTIQSAIDAI